MEKYYDLRCKDISESKVTVCFGAMTECNLKVIRIKFFYKNQEFDSPEIMIRDVRLKANENRYVIFGFPQQGRQYTSINFIVKDTTHQTQYAIRLPLDGSEPQFTKMLYGE